MRVNERKASSRKDLPRLFALSAALFSGAMFASSRCSFVSTKAYRRKSWRPSLM